jgi:hypothetical protein
MESFFSDFFTEFLSKDKLLTVSENIAHLALNSGIVL